jgi:hypothetical protein
MKFNLQLPGGRSRRVDLRFLRDADIGRQSPERAGWLLERDIDNSARAMHPQVRDESAARLHLHNRRAGGVPSDLSRTLPRSNGPSNGYKTAPSPPPRTVSPAHTREGLKNAVITT